MFDWQAFIEDDAEGNICITSNWATTSTRVSLQCGYRGQVTACIL